MLLDEPCKADRRRGSKEGGSAQGYMIMLPVSGISGVKRDPRSPAMGKRFDSAPVGNSTHLPSFADVLVLSPRKASSSLLKRMYRGRAPHTYSEYALPPRRPYGPALIARTLNNYERGKVGEWVPGMGGGKAGSRGRGWDAPTNELLALGGLEYGWMDVPGRQGALEAWPRRHKRSNREK